jgi:hypothetical protein
LVPVGAFIEQVVAGMGAEIQAARRPPPVPQREQLLFVVQQLLPRLGGELKVGALHDGVDGARLLRWCDGVGDVLWYVI